MSDSPAAHEPPANDAPTAHPETPEPGTGPTWPAMESDAPTLATDRTPEDPAADPAHR